MAFSDLVSVSMAKEYGLVCGIAGIVDLNGEAVDPRVLLAMRDQMVHRGPNDHGAVLLNWPGSRSGVTEPFHYALFRDVGELGSNTALNQRYTVGLAHRRLSILDLSAEGRQPMSNEDATIWVVYNGEIYNFRQIRDELQMRGHNFRSQTDTEVILHAYEEYGMDCIERFIGMFAIAVLDCRKRELVLIRDRMGIKPLYYCIAGGRFLFASEIKALLQYPGIFRAVDDNSFYHYLSFRCAPPPATLFKGISKVEAGHFLQIDERGKIYIERYWNMFNGRNEESFRRPEPEICDEVLDLLKDSTRLRMISDVPFGAFLSGGLDSSLNVALMSDILKRPVNTFSIGFEGTTEFNELHWARLVAETFGTNHHEVTISADETIAFLPNLIFYQDEPIADPTCVPVYFLSKLARQHGVTVCQVGEGSDELFCGYPLWLSILNQYSQAKTLSGKLKSLPIILGSYIAGRTTGVGWGVYDHSLPFWKGGDFFWGGAVDYRDMQKRAIVSQRVLKAVRYSTSDLISQYRKRFDALCYKPDDLTWMTYFDLLLRLPELLLMRMDKMSMAMSLETRVPFLDHRLVELSLGLPQEAKVRDRQSKYLLKKAARGLLPSRIMDRPKQGFQLPVKQWYGQSLRGYFQEVLDDFLKKTDYFDVSGLRQFTNRKGIPWIIINFALWYQIWIDNKTSLTRAQ